MARLENLNVPARATVTGRTTSMTAAFFASMLPRHEPTEEERLDVVRCLGLDPDDVRCAYCGDVATEWDHLRPTVRNRHPTGWLTEAANLVPACGKCNQSKGNAEWRIWIRGPARHSPATRNIADLDQKVEALERFEAKFPCKQMDILALLERNQTWTTYRALLDDIVERMREADRLSAQLRQQLGEHL